MKNISFKQFYEGLPKVLSPKQEFISTVARLTHKKEGTVKMWLSGYHKPDELCIRTIAEHYGLNPDTLFPELPKSK